MAVLLIAFSAVGIGAIVMGDASRRMLIRVFLVHPAAERHGFEAGRRS